MKAKGRKKGKDPIFKKAVMKCVHEGLVKSLEIEDWDRFQRIIEHVGNNLEKVVCMKIFVIPDKSTKMQEKTAYQTG